MHKAAVAIARWLLFAVAGLMPAWGAAATGASTLSLWPTIPFVRGQDLCQFEDAYGRSRSAQRRELTRDVMQMVMLGANPTEAAASLQALDRLIDKNRQQATAGYGMDVLLEGTLKAQIDRIYSRLRPQVPALRFHNPSTLTALLEDVREQRRQGRLDSEQARRIDGLIWGTYSYAPGCKGEIVVTIHVEQRNGSSTSFGCAGRPDHVAAQLATQVFRHFQGTRLPSTIQVGGRALTILGAAPGAAQAHASSQTMAASACRALNGRLPNLAEIEAVGLLGEWNGGLDLGQDAWLLDDGRLYVPSLPRPSPIRQAAEMAGEDQHFFCVR